MATQSWIAAVLSVGLVASLEALAAPGSLIVAAGVLAAWGAAAHRSLIGELLGPSDDRPHRPAIC